MVVPPTQSGDDVRPGGSQAPPPPTHASIFWMSRGNNEGGHSVKLMIYFVFVVVLTYAETRWSLRANRSGGKSLQCEASLLAEMPRRVSVLDCRFPEQKCWYYSSIGVQQLKTIDKNVRPVSYCVYNMHRFMYSMGKW